MAINKIIDRIIAQEGFEHILSVDYKTGPAGSRNVSAIQTPLKHNAAPFAQAFNAEMTSQASASSQDSASSKDKRGRPLSMIMARTFSGAAEKTPVVEEVLLPSPLTTSVEPSRATVAKQEKRVGFAHRTILHASLPLLILICDRLAEASLLIFAPSALVESRAPDLPDQLCDHLRSLHVLSAQLHPPCNKKREPLLVANLNLRKKMKKTNEKDIEWKQP